MKKLLTFLLAFGFMFGVAACNGNQQTEEAETETEEVFDETEQEIDEAGDEVEQEMEEDTTAVE